VRRGQPTQMMKGMVRRRRRARGVVKDIVNSEQ
jgi:hypothetical protein